MSTWQKWRGRILHLSFRLRRPMTLGAQGVVIDRQQRVLLVRHTYVPGWHFPGGGVEAGETIREALARELLEEANIEVQGTPQLHGIFFNDQNSRRDHVACFIVRHYHQTGLRAPDHEIAETGFFAPHELPEGTTRAVRARLAEILENQPIAEKW
ncbi:MAG: NUDIX domain-containing protein [Hyphomicrobiales bacterium]|nr:NUDIX domain-containing protein [Hyphomicrobiales bacterium]MDE2115365.1 NUDIX domain-containing protein [Hyphomicrobiales bacterium]